MIKFIFSNFIEKMSGNNFTNNTWRKISRNIVRKCFTRTIPKLTIASSRPKNLNEFFPKIFYLVFRLKMSGGKYIPPSARSSSKIVPETISLPSITPVPLAATRESQGVYSPPTSTTKSTGKMVKQVDTSSTIEFPALGSSSTPKPQGTKTAAQQNFASLAKSWADKDEDDRKKKEQEEIQRNAERVQAQFVGTHIRLFKQTIDTSYTDGQVNSNTNVYDYEYDGFEEEDEHPNQPSSNPLGIKRDHFGF